MDMLKRIEQYMAEHEMVQQGDRVIVGVSGGCDSVCLLLCMQEIGKRRGFPVRAVHVNHGIRGEEAEEDERFVRLLCERENIPLSVFREDIPALAARHGKSLEEMGRERRYAIFEQEAADWETADRETADRKTADREASARGTVKIAVAHHMGDQSETLLMNLLRGSGPRGLCGIPPVRGRIIRPLLAISRGELAHYLERRGQPWREDASNADESYARNFLRGSILPMLRERWPLADEQLSRAALLLREQQQFMDRLAGRWLSDNAEASDGAVTLPAALLREEPALRKCVLQQALQRCGGLRDITAVHLGALDELIALPGSHRLSLPGKRLALASYGRLTIRTQENNPERRILPRLRCEFFCVNKLEKIPEKQYTKWLDYDTIKEPLTLRTRRAGDYFYLKDGGRKTVKSYMIDCKIPAGQRDHIPVLAAGSHVVWIVGYRISDACPVTDKTRKILKISVGGAND